MDWQHAQFVPPQAQAGSVIARKNRLFPMAQCVLFLWPEVFGRVRSIRRPSPHGLQAA